MGIEKARNVISTRIRLPVLHEWRMLLVAILSSPTCANRERKREGEREREREREREIS
jgi:hypothetical protein